MFTIIFRQIKKDHVGTLRWHRARTNDRKAWEKQINRKDFKISNSTVVCSNHFSAGYYSDVCNVPTLFMKGYTDSDTDSSVKRKEPTQREQEPIKVKRPRNMFRDGSDATPPETETLRFKHRIGPCLVPL